MPRDITKIKHRIIENPYLNVVLYRPEIPANTGNIARLCGAAEIPLHLIHPLGFEVDDKHLRRAGLDYWDEVDVRHHSDFKSFLKNMDVKRNCYFTSNHASNYLPIRAKLPHEKEKVVKLLEKVLKEKDESILKPEHMRAL